MLTEKKQQLANLKKYEMKSGIHSSSSPNIALEGYFNLGCDRNIIEALGRYKILGNSLGATPRHLASTDLTRNPMPSSEMEELSHL